ncbi:hypothetical protein AA0498_0487 [Acidomonas methanolica]|uniref:Uncharacterized protein n=1 Tax=Acidomonas methanolica NBRC 104435 TaxID=1231351 RepID=A0A023D1Z7_ACIMT|nr:hypothetical protein Amme_013_068 [Acidomonas methanolica NBRC 104435]GBQ47268.1 hypothetical protein AA0498_0487 [Acidomonas methanolica]GEK98678.1 hypothetical protein AME01nite_11770 [Acidomonas methanolica NBRC 104435]
MTDRAGKPAFRPPAQENDGPPPSSDTLAPLPDPVCPGRTCHPPDKNREGSPFVTVMKYNDAFHAPQKPYEILPPMKRGAPGM